MRKILIAVGAAMAVLLSGAVATASAAAPSANDQYLRVGVSPTFTPIDPPTTETNQPTEPTLPTEPTQPTLPTEPTQPTEPTLPTEPTQPTLPTEPTQPTEPTTPLLWSGAGSANLPLTNGGRWVLTGDGITGATINVAGEVGTMVQDSPNGLRSTRNGPATSWSFDSTGPFVDGDSVTVSYTGYSDNAVLTLAWNNDAVSDDTNDAGYLPPSAAADTAEMGIPMSFVLILGIFAALGLTLIFGSRAIRRNKASAHTHS